MKKGRKGCFVEKKEGKTTCKDCKDYGGYVLCKEKKQEGVCVVAYIKKGFLLG